MKIVLATHNAHKVDELRRILGPALDGFELIGYDGPEPIEDGESFAANALIKARAASQHTGLAALADDSGICVDALRGTPGIHSARYSGTRDDLANVEKLLGTLSESSDRTAHFECAAALVIPPPPESVGPDGPQNIAAPEEFTETGIWPGRVLMAPAGEGGFGYDPIFQPDGHEVSAAELTADQKNAESHRAIAFGKILSIVREHLAP